MVAGLLARLLRLGMDPRGQCEVLKGIRTLGGLLNALRERRLLNLEFLFIAALKGSFLDC